LTGVQIHHLFQIAEQDGKKGALKAGMEHMVKASIGPTTSETLRSYGLLVDLEAFSREGSSGTVGSIVSEDPIAFPVIWLEGDLQGENRIVVRQQSCFPASAGNSVLSLLRFPFQVEHAPEVRGLIHRRANKL
jgi:hypothetical protein